MERFRNSHLLFAVLIQIAAFRRIQSASDSSDSSTNISSQLPQLQIVWFYSSVSTSEQYNGNASSSVISFLYGVSALLTLVSNNINISVVWIDDKCDRFQAAGGSMQTLANSYAKIFVGPACSAAMWSAGANGGFFNVPVVTSSALDPSFTNWGFLTRVNIPGKRYAERAGRMMQSYGWNKALMIVCQDDYLSVAISNAVVLYFSTVNYRLYLAYSNLNSSVSDIVTAYASLTSQFAYRIIVLLVPTKLLRQYLLAAYQSGMVAKGYVFSTFDSNMNFDITEASNLWTVGDGYDSQVLIAMQNIIINRVSFQTTASVLDSGSSSSELLSSASTTEFQLAASFAAQQLLANTKLNSSGQLPPAAGFDNGNAVLYDVLYLIGLTVNYSISNGLNFTQGTKFLASASLFPFIGASGFVRLDQNGDRVTNFFQICWDSSSSQWQIVNYIVVTVNSDADASTYETVYEMNPMNWPGGLKGSANAPTDTICFDCDQLSALALGLIIAAAVLALALSITAVYFLCCKRRDLNETSWLIPFENLLLIDEKSGTASALNDSASTSHDDVDGSGSGSVTEEKTSSVLSHRNVARLQASLLIN